MNIEEQIKEILKEPAEYTYDAEYPYWLRFGGVCECDDGFFCSHRRSWLIEELTNLLTQQREEARKEEAKRWINQPASKGFPVVWSGSPKDIPAGWEKVTAMNIQEIKKVIHKVLKEWDVAYAFTNSSKDRMVEQMAENLTNLLTQQSEKARKEEAERWINQPANEHDNRIREEAVGGFIEFLSKNPILINEASVMSREMEEHAETYLTSTERTNNERF